MRALARTWQEEALALRPVAVDHVFKVRLVLCAVLTRVWPLWAALELVVCDLISTDALLAMEALDRQTDSLPAGVAIGAVGRSSNARPASPIHPPTCSREGDGGSSHGTHLGIVSDPC